MKHLFLVFMVITGVCYGCWDCIVIRICVAEATNVSR